MKMSLMEDARTLGILKYISPLEEFDTEEDKIGEALYRASEVCLFAYEEGKQNFQEFSDAVQDLKRFCQKHGYDFGEYCHNVQNYATMKITDVRNTTETEENTKGRYYI